MGDFPNLVTYNYLNTLSKTINFLINIKISCCVQYQNPVHKKFPEVQYNPTCLPALFCTAILNSSTFPSLHPYCLNEKVAYYTHTKIDALILQKLFKITISLNEPLVHLRNSVTLNLICSL